MSLYDIFPVKEVSGDIVTFEDGADGIPIDSLSAVIEYIQDLHGYANPWPGGGGKNLIAYPYTSADGQYGGVTFTTEDEKIVAVGTTSNSFIFTLATVHLSAGTYTLSADGTHTTVQFRARRSGVNVATLSSYQQNVTFTLSEDSDIVFDIVRLGDNIDINTHIMCELGSTASIWEPYANICPITGLTGLSVYRTGKNLVDMESVTREYFCRAGNVSAGSPLGALASNASWSCSDYIAVEPNTEYTQTLPGYNSAGAAGLVFFSDKSVESAISGVPTTTQGSATYTFTTPANCHYVRISWQTSNEGSGSYPYPQLEKGSKTEYEAYNGNTYSVDWTTQVGTVCQGTVDPVAGILNVVKVGVDLGSLSWTKYGSTANYDRYITSGIDSLAKSSSSVVCSIYKARVGSETITANMIWIASGNSKLSVTTNVGAFANATNFKSGMSGQILVFEISEQQPIQLTPMQISTLLGENNVWANVAPITVRYHSRIQTEGKQIDSLFVDGVDMQADGWFLKWRKLAAPKPKTDYVSVWGRDGDIDLTESETGGQVFYENRELTMDMVYIGEDWTDAYSELLDKLHGKDCLVQFLNDPYWYWAGRIVASLYEHKPRSLSMSGIMFPYKLSILKIEKSATVSGVTESNAVEVVLPGSRMRVSPKVTVTAGSGDSVTLKWGNKTQALSAGTYYVRGLKVGSEDVTIKIWGTGTAEFEYRKGML